MANPNQPAPQKQPMTGSHMSELTALHDQIAGMPDGPEKAEKQALFREFHGFLMEKMDPPMEGNGPLDWIAGKALGAMDYGSGLIRTIPIAAGDASQGLAQGKGLGQAWQDVKDAVVPFDDKIAPGVGEALKRWGVPPGPSMKVGKFNPDVRDLVGGIGDTALSPWGVGAASRMGLKATGRSMEQRLAGMTAPAIVNEFKLAESARNAMSPAQKVANVMLPSTGIKTGAGFVPGAILDPMGTALDRGGEHLYRSAFKAADRASEAAGQGRVSSVLLRNDGLIGNTSAGYEKKAQALREALGKSTAERATGDVMASPLFGADRGSMLHQTWNYLKEQGERLGRTEASEAAKNEIKGHFKTTFGTKAEHPHFTMAELQEIRQEAQGRARALGAYNNGPPPKGSPQKAVEKAIGGDVRGKAWGKVGQIARREIEDNLDEFSPGMGGKQFMENRDLGALIAAEKPMGDAAARGLSIREGIPGALAGGTMAAPALALGNPKLAAVLFASGLAANSTLGRTTLGLGAQKLGPAAAAALRATGIPASRKLSPWDQLQAGIAEEQEKAKK